jgi:hypothetical protein
MRNDISRQPEVLFSQTEDMADGCKAHEVAIGMQLNKEAPMRLSLANARAAHNSYQAARTAKLNAAQTVRSADADARAFIIIARDNLKPRLGSSWSQMWAEAGFTGGSLAMPKTRAKRMELVMSLKTYFTAHQNYKWSRPASRQTRPQTATPICPTRIAR